MADDKRQLPEWIEAQRSLMRDKVDWPLHGEFQILRYGAYGAVRTDPATGWCPYKNQRKPDPDPATEAKLRQADYPCKHYGVDLSAPKGTPVYAPHDGWLLYLGLSTKAPFIGYGPGVALLAHNDTQDSLWERTWVWLTDTGVFRSLDAWKFPDGQVAARYSLLGHITPIHVPPAQLTHAPEAYLPIEIEHPDAPEYRSPIPLPPDIWQSGEPHDEKDRHWRTLEDGTVAMMSGADAVTQSTEAFPGAKKLIDRWVNTGDLIGHVSDAGHVHWEIRTSPLAGIEGRVDPIQIWEQAYNATLPTGTDKPTPVPQPRPQPPAPSGGIGGLLLLGAAFLFGRRRPRPERQRR